MENYVNENTDFFNFQDDKFFTFQLICCFYFRYRLVRHTWNLNVNESLSLDATCTLNSALSHDLGIDLYVKNQNQVHHALVTEIFLSDLTLFCPTYKFISNSIKCELDFFYSWIMKFIFNARSVLTFRFTKSWIQSCCDSKQRFTN